MKKILVSLLAALGLSLSLSAQAAGGDTIA